MSPTFLSLKLTTKKKKSSLLKQIVSAICCNNKEQDKERKQTKSSFIIAGKVNLRYPLGTRKNSPQNNEK